MVQTYVRVEGVKNLIKYMGKLPENLNKQLSQGNKQFMKDLKKSAKLRAPRDTGDLADSITVSQTKKKGLSNQWKLEVGSPYGVYQEFGFTPHVTTQINPSSNKLGHKAGEPVMVSKFTPFIQPAFDEMILKLNGILDTYTARAISFK